jgi:hypothetical protein
MESTPQENAKRVGEEELERGKMQKDFKKEIPLRTVTPPPIEETEKNAATGRCESYPDLECIRGLSRGWGIHITMIDREEAALFPRG